MSFKNHREKPKTEEEKQKVHERVVHTEEDLDKLKVLYEKLDFAKAHSDSDPAEIEKLKQEIAEVKKDLLKIEQSD